MTRQLELATLAGLLAALTCTGCDTTHGGILDYESLESGWIGMYAGEGQVNSFTTANGCDGVQVELTLGENGDGELVAEVHWWEPLGFPGQSCAYQDLCAPASVFNANTSGSCFVHDLRNVPTSSSYSATAESGSARLELSLERTEDFIMGSLLTDAISTAVPPHGELTFSVTRCATLPCEF